MRSIVRAVSGPLDGSDFADVQLLRAKFVILVQLDVLRYMQSEATTGSNGIFRMRIGELARATSTKVETIRFYEKIGLLAAPARTSGNYRDYEAEHLGRLSFIRRARDLGFTLDQVRELLALSDDRSSPCSAVDAVAREHLAEIDRKVADLRALRRELDELISRCSQGAISECRIIEALGPSGESTH